MQMNATGHSAPQKIYSEAKGNQPGRFLNGHRFAVFAVFQLEQQKKTKSEAFFFSAAAGNQQLILQFYH